MMRLLCNYLNWVITWIVVIILISYLGAQLGGFEMRDGVPRLPPGCCSP